MLALLFAVITVLPQDALVPVTSQCPALHRAWDPLIAAAADPKPGDSDLQRQIAAGKALRACGDKIRADEHALALMLLDDLGASFSERIAVTQPDADPAQVHRQYWGLFDQAFDDAEHWSKFLHFPRSRQCGAVFAEWIRNERQAVWFQGADATKPLLATSRYTDPAALQCVAEVTGWKTPAPRTASPAVPGRPPHR